VKVQNLLTELKRRRVFRVAVVYAGIAFIVFQIVDATFDYLPIPDWVGTTLIVVLLLGFPIAVSLAWAFDITEKGVVRAAAKGTEEAKAPRRPLIGNKTLAIVAALAVAAAVWSWWGRPASAGPITSIAVLPLENLMGDPDQDYFVDGMHEALITELSRISALKVISRTSAMYYKDKDIRTPEIARQLKVEAVVEGSVFKAEGQVRITAQLIDGRTDRHLWANDYSRALTDIIALQKSIASAIAQEIEITLTPEEEAKLASTHTVDPGTYQLYLRSRYHWNKRIGEDLKKAIEYFNQVIEKDQQYAPAYTGLADSYNMLPYYSNVPPNEAYPKARAAAMQALELDNTLAEAHTSLAYVSHVYDWNWSEAEIEFKRAIELNPGYPSAHQWYGYYLADLLRYDEAIEEMKLALEMDPISFIVNTNLGDILYHARQYDQAREQYQITLELYPYNPRLHRALGNVYVGKRMFEKAIEMYKRGMVLSGASPEEIAALGNAYDISGMTGVWKWQLERLEEKSKQVYVDPYDVARIYADLGERDQAFQWLEKAYEDRAPELVELKNTHAFHPLRSDPRFQDLLRRMNFPE